MTEVKPGQLWQFKDAKIANNDGTFMIIKVHQQHPMVNVCYVSGVLKGSWRCYPADVILEFDTLVSDV